MDADSALWMLGAFVGGIVTVAGVVTLLRAVGADQPAELFVEHRLSSPLGYQNANAALWTMAAAARARARLLARGEHRVAGAAFFRNVRPSPARNARRVAQFPERFVEAQRPRSVNSAQRLLDQALPGIEGLRGAQIIARAGNQRPGEPNEPVVRLSLGGLRESGPRAGGRLPARR